MTRMRREEWIGFAPSHVGKVRANHTADYCEGGRASMVVERKSDGTLSAYCFRCLRNGFARADGTPYPRVAALKRTAHAGSDDTVEELRLSAGSAGGYSGRSGPPSSAVGEWKRFGSLAKAWLLKARLTPTKIEEEGFLWDEASQELFIPIKHEGNVVGWQARSFAGEGKKYTTMAEDKSKLFSHYVTGSNVLLITEDVLSALRGAEICDSMGLLGVSLKPSAIVAIAQKNYDKCVVFLDGDNPQVKLAARKIVKRLPFLRTVVVETGKDPKHHSKEELECLILK